MNRLKANQTDNFLREYQGHRFEDWGSYCSDDFKSFARKFKNYLKRNLPKDCEIVGHHCNHYDLSGFVTKGDRCVYYSFNWNRFSPVDVNEVDYIRNSVLFRRAKDDKDYHGETNQFTSIADLPNMIMAILA